MFKNVTKVIIINIIILCLIIVCLELIYRALYPEFMNHVHSKDITYGKHVAYGDFIGQPVRAPYAGYKIEPKESPVIVIFGDSITNGCGSAYEDIFWVRLKRLLNNTASSPIEVVGLASVGNDLSDAVKQLEELVSEKGKSINIKYVMYQFNFNDITLFGNSEIKAGAHLKGIEHTPLFAKVAVLRYQYLNKSVFLRVLQYYTGIWKLKTRGTCEERGYDALKEYTWSFGCKPFQAESEELWQKFENSLKRFKEASDKIHANCSIFISPILYDIDPEMRHPHIKEFNLDFSCATINPRKRLTEITQKLNIEIIDPMDYVKEHFENRVREENIEYFYFTGDDNHFTPIASEYIAEFLFNYFTKKMDNN